MSLQVIVVALIFLVFAMAWYSANKLQNQIHCSYHRVDKTVIEKFTKRSSNYVIFDKARYKVVPDRISLIRWKRGIHQFLPIWVQHLDFNWDNEYPQDPSNYRTSILSPEVRNALNQEDRLKSYARSQQAQLGGKKPSMLKEYLPWIAMGGVLIALFMVWTISKDMNTVKQAILLIPK